MTVRLAINGLGRIGRNVVRAAKAAKADVDFVAVNDLADLDTLAHLLKYDTVYGIAGFEVNKTDSGIQIDRDDVVVLSERDPARLPWDDLGIDVVVESTGVFTTRAKASLHLQAGAERVIVSAPSKDADAMVVLGVNDHIFDPQNHFVVSNASCTTNCFAPMVKVIDDAFGVDRGIITTIHAYTATQNVVDGYHRDLRRARAAAVNLIPTSTGAAEATGDILAHLLGRLNGIAVRVPVPAGSMTDCVMMLNSDVTADDVNSAFLAAATEGSLSKVLAYSDEPLVSSDIVGRSESCIFDSDLTMTLGGNMVKVCGWYDNEWGYANRLIELAAKMGGH